MNPAAIKTGRLFLLWLLLAEATPCRASDPIAGIWLGQSGPEDNRVTLGLEIFHAPGGQLMARASIDLLGIYGQDLGALRQLAPLRYSVPAADMRLTLSENQLQVTGFLHDPGDPATLRRAALRPTAPPHARKLPGAGPVWKTHLGGAIFAPAAVYAGIAYLGNSDGVLTAISVADGSRVWSFAAGRPIFGEALTTSDSIYFVCDNGFLFRLERGTGREIWRYDLGDARARRVLPNPFIFDYDYRAPRPELADGVLFLGSADGALHAVRADTGEQVWRLSGVGSIRNTVAILGPQVIFSTEAGLVAAVERASGRKLWQFDAKAPVTAPAVVAGRVLVGARDSMLYGLDPADGHTVWSQYWWGSWVESTAVESNGLAYVGSGDLTRVSCIDPASGHNLWRTEVGGWVLQRPLVTGKMVYAGVSGARRNASYWPPQVSALTALDRATGRIVWQWSLPVPPGVFLHGFVAAPVSAGDRVLIGGVDGTLYAFRAE